MREREVVVGHGQLRRSPHLELGIGVEETAKKTQHVPAERFT
jgi:hypothetical protein